MIGYYTLTVLTTALFLRAFFPVSVSTNYYQNKIPDDIATIPEPEETHPEYDKVVFIVIDALRHDFIQPHAMSYTWMKSQSSGGCLTKLKAETPTVTMPRIKALTSGNVPQFLDVVRNLASSEVLLDSWLHSAKKAGKKIVFYGDNTWLKLFPNFFYRSEGTTSFFVHDFKEVDDNVTRNVLNELNMADWNIMILHYLGLDHIGHVHGPFHHLVKLKLVEMDHIISIIHQKLESSYKNPLVIITADHGMRDSGGHGGSTHSETHVPLVSIGLNCNKAFFPQTDLPANLAALLGFDIPSTSIGQIHEHFLKPLPFAKYLHVLRTNTRLLLKKENFCNKDFERATKLHSEFLESGSVEIGKETAEIYKNCSEKIGNLLIRSSVEQDDYSLIIALLLFSDILLTYFNEIFEQTRYDFSNFRFFVLLFIVSIQLFITIPTISVIFIIVLILTITIKYYKTFSNLQFKRECDLSILLGFVLIFHPFTFFSSSFVEEEHQYWYFFLNTGIVLVLINILNSKSNYLKVAKFLLILICFRFLRRLNSVGDQWASYPDISDWLLKDENYLFCHLFFLFGLLLILFFDYIISRKIIELFHSAVILTLTFVFKTVQHQSVILPRIIWFLIALKGRNWLIFMPILLLKPSNIALIPFCLYTSMVISKNVESTVILTVLHIFLSNCLYFAQGHSNTLASVDVSVGYIGLQDYNPLLVIPQVLLHTYAFHLLSHKLVLPKIDKNKFWVTLFGHRTLALTLTCITTFVNRQHLFIWSVFAPKLFIESVHLLFLYVEHTTYVILDFCYKLKSKKPKYY